MGRGNVVSFCHEYDKLQGIKDGDEAILCHATTIVDGDIDEKFEHFDTLFRDEGEEDHYPLPKTGDLIFLLFYCEKARKFFPTLRRWTPEKARYYEGSVGKEFAVNIRPTTE